MKYEAYKTMFGNWRWRLKARNGEIVASGERYSRRIDCLRAIALLKATNSRTPIVML